MSRLRRVRSQSAKPEKGVGGAAGRSAEARLKTAQDTVDEALSRALALQSRLRVQNETYQQQAAASADALQPHIRRLRREMESAGSDEERRNKEDGYLHAIRLRGLAHIARGTAQGLSRFLEHPLEPANPDKAT